MGEDQVTRWLCERHGGIVPQNTDQKRVDLGLFLPNNRQIDQTIPLKSMKRETVLDEGGFQVDETFSREGFTNHSAAGCSSASKTGRYFAARPKARMPKENMPTDKSTSGSEGI
jgi:hypothetical protein